MTVFSGDILTATAAPVFTEVAPTRTWQWLRGSTAITGATTSTYRATDADVGSTLAVTQIETNFLGSDTATSAATAVVGAWSPSTLFASSEPGVWYDFDDTTAMFQDSAGTIPVTGPNQPVGLLLDKSRGLVLGPELVTNGDFSSGSTGWSAQSGWTLGSGVASVNSSVAGSTYLRTSSFSAVAGTYYRVTFTVTSYTSGSIFAAAGTAGSTTSATAVGTYTFLVQAAGSGGVGVYALGTNTIATVDNISVRELPGFHAAQSVAAARPTYGIVPATGRRNLFNDTDKPTAITGTTVTANAAVAPNGQTTAARVAKTDATTPRYVTQATLMTVQANTTYTVSRYVKHDGFDTIVSLEYNSSGNFNLDWVAGFTVTASGVVASTPTACTSSVVNAGNGWYRISATFTSGASITTPTNPSVLSRITGASGVSVLMTDAQIELGSTATAYQRVVSQFEVTEAGVPSLGYLSFDGTDDFLVTPTITPNTDKVQVFAGVRTIGSTQGLLAELSASTATNNGAWNIQVPLSAAGEYRFVTKGTSTVAIDSLGITPPNTRVLTAISDIVADSAVLRLNGSQVAQSSADQGTGNFLAYPLFIGRRGGTLIPFNGQLYSLIVRFGANLSTSVINRAEYYVSNKTGVTL